MIGSHKEKRMSTGEKDVTVHHFHTGFTVRLVPGCVGVYPWSQLPCALATQNLAGGVRCFRRGFHKKVFCHISSPPVSYTLSFPSSLSCSLPLLAFLLVSVFEFARDSLLQGRELLFLHCFGTIPYC